MEGQIHLFEARAEELKQKALELLHPPSIPVDEESDVGLAINLLLEKKIGDRPVGFLSRGIQAIKNGKSRFAPSLQIPDTLSGSTNAPSLLAGSTPTELLKKRFSTLRPHLIFQLPHFGSNCRKPLCSIHSHTC